jgi:hypothetical protein
VVGGWEVASVICISTDVTCFIRIWRIEDIYDDEYIIYDVV